MSQRDLAEAIGLPDDGSLSRIERGEEVVSEVLLRRIARELDIPWEAVTAALGPARLNASRQANPYKGLAAFRESDASLYFGRSRIADLVVSKLIYTPIAAIIGASGSGKSSLVAAGVVPTLRQESDILAVMVRPGSRPFDSIAVALYPHLKVDPQESERNAIHDLARRLQTGHSYIELERLLQEIRGRKNLLVVVDQFEELFTQCRETVVRQSFIRLLVEIAKSHGASSDSPRVLIVLRADFFGHVVADRILADTLQDQIIHLPPMSKDELEEAIRRPAEATGCEFEPGLVRLIVDDAGDEPGRIPLVQYCLSLLWNVRVGSTLTFAAYRTLGGLDGAIAGQSERVFLGFGASGQRAARRLVTRLVRVGEARIGSETRRRLPVSDVARSSSEREVLEGLIGARLVTTDFDEALGAETVELAHEAVIGHWSRLQDWLVEDRQFLLWQQRLERTAKDWATGGEADEFLVRGRLLVEAERWAESRLDDMTPELRAFISASGRVRDLEAATRALEQVKFLLTAEPSEVPRIVADLKEQQRWTLPRLHELLSTADLSRKWRARLALLDTDEGQLMPLADYLIECLPGEFSAILDALRPYGGEILPRLRLVVSDSNSETGAILRAASALSVLWPNEPVLATASPKIAEILVRENPLHLLSWIEPLRAIRDLLMPDLRRMMIDSKQPIGLKESCALVLLQFISGDPSLLASVTTETSVEAFPLLFEELRSVATGSENIHQELQESIVQDPVVMPATEDQARYLGRRRAVAAVVDMRLGFRPPLEAFLNGAADPEAGTQFVHQARLRGLPAEQLAILLLESADPMSRYWLALALGDYRPEEIPQARFTEIRSSLTQWYRSDPAASVHSAAGWLLRHWQVGTNLDEIDSDTVGLAQIGSREWFTIGPTDAPLSFVRVPAGPFMMGCDPAEAGSKHYETPRREIEISRDFAMSVREVSRGEYEEFVSDTGHVPLPNIDDWSPTPSHPVVGLTWYEAEEYLAWLSNKLDLYHFADGVDSGRASALRLPTEAEWEKACRAGTTTAFSFGSDRALLQHYAWYQENSNLQTRPEMLRPNRYGLHNMHGNTWEWCSDWYGLYGSEGELDPKGPQRSDWRVLRGGCWNLNERYSRSACRNWHIPTNRNWYIGLRMALTIPRNI